MGGDKIVVFEEENFESLRDKFFRDNRDVQARWDTFVYEQWERSESYEPPEPDR